MSLTFLQSLIAAFVLCTFQYSPVAAQKVGTTQLFRGFTLIDPATRRRVSNAFILVRNGKIVRIGRGTPPRVIGDVQTVDLGGRFLLPGFIDAHAHITGSGLQKVEVQNGQLRITMESDDASMRQNARIALSRGVTTVRNPGGDPAAAVRYDANIRSGTWLGPEALHAGAVVEPPPFGGSMFVYPRTPAEWDAEAAGQAKLGMRYLKLYSSLAEAEVAEGIKAAHRYGLKAIGHLNAVSWTRAAELGIDGLEHALPTSADLLPANKRSHYVSRPDSTFMYRWFELVDFDAPEFQAMLRLLSKRRVVTNMTLVVNELVYGIDDLDRVYPASERVGADPEVLMQLLANLRASSAGWTKEDFARAKAAMPKVLEFARRIHAAGIPMMIGTDAGGGIFFARELALHRAAGIPAWDVLRMATSGAADAIGIGNRTGRLRRGYEADFVFLNGDPLADISAAARVDAVVADGRLLRPANLIDVHD